MMVAMKDRARTLIRALGWEVRKYRPHHDPLQRFLLTLKRWKVSLVLDVGANIGQFAESIRKGGYEERIVSFEPLSDAYTKLLDAARRDPLWTVAPRCAVASKAGAVEINIAANSQSSSILNMVERHVTGDPQSVYIAKEKVPTTTLDEFLDREPYAPNVTIALKIDTQGYESEVLAGLSRWSGEVKVIMIEMSLTSLYEGEALFVDLYRMIEARGYQCISIERGFTDPRTYEVLQVDGIFERVQS
jgi:FkbM family methyltransferase